MSTSPLAGAPMGKKLTPSTLDLKVQTKTALQQEIGWPREPRRPLVCLPAGMTDALGGELLQDVLPGILAMPVEILVLGRGTPAYGALFTKLVKEHSHRVHIVPDRPESVAQMLLAADMALFLSNALPAKEIAQCLEHGVVPLSPAGADLDDYNPVQETGNAFLYESLNKWHCFSSLVRAVETYKFPFDWKTIQRHCLDTVKE